MRAGSVAVVFGTRPEIVKLAPVIWALGPAARSIHSGQHYDAALSEVFLDELGLHTPDIALAVGGMTRAAQIGTALLALDDLFERERPDVVVVQGDTNTALAGALAANGRDIPLVHVEAGLRSFDRAMPEEHNRVVADHLSDLCCAPTETSRANLEAEGIAADRIEVTGNTVVDAVERVVPDGATRNLMLERRSLTPDGYVLATLHRPENVDDPEVFRSILDELAVLPLPVLLPLHPRSVARAATFGLEDALARIRVIEPLAYSEFLAFARECAFLISDSGGVQEEASVLKRPVLVFRRSTERPEVLGTFSELVSTGPALRARALEWAGDVAALHARLGRLPSPYGDGHAGTRIAAAIARLGAEG